MSVCQVAIRFADAHPNHHLVRTLPLGGEKTGQRQSLAQRIARFLSAAAQGLGSGIEASFISHQNIEEFLFDNNGSPVRVSGLGRRGHSTFVCAPTVDPGDPVPVPWRVVEWPYVPRHLAPPSARASIRLRRTKPASGLGPCG
ncbi:MAG: hypothetical protein F4X99_00615 [Gammaproteobacteria bacterium]|nr:hypothetical protein [Gammaproteobacteria bacterium]